MLMFVRWVEVCLVALRSSYLIKVAVRDVDVPRLTHPDADGAEGGALQGLDSDVQRGPGELGVINKHHSVSGDDATVLRKMCVNIGKYSWHPLIDIYATLHKYVCS